MSENLLPCIFCNKPPGSKAGPPALVRCLTDGCEGKKIAAVTVKEWGIRNLAPETPEPPARDRLEEVANQFVGEAFCADWHDPDGSNKGVREVARVKEFFIERLTRFACDEIRLHMAREPQRSTATPSPTPDSPRRLSTMRTTPPELSGQGSETSETGVFSSDAMTDDEAMRRLSASEVACYRWPDDTVIHKALRNAFMDGAAIADPRNDRGGPQS